MGVHDDQSFFGVGRRFRAKPGFDIPTQVRLPALKSLIFLGR
jgi:hypothetical protein